MKVALVGTEHHLVVPSSAISLGLEAVYWQFTVRNDSESPEQGLGVTCTKKNTKGPERRKSPSVKWWPSAFTVACGDADTFSED